jgi:hypothetical protein
VWPSMARWGIERCGSATFCRYENLPPAGAFTIHRSWLRNTKVLTAVVVWPTRPFQANVSTSDYTLGWIASVLPTSGTAAAFSDNATSRPVVLDGQFPLGAASM